MSTDAKYNKGRPPGRAAPRPPNRSRSTVPSVPSPPGRDKPAAGRSDRWLRHSPHFSAPPLRLLEAIPPTSVARGANGTNPPPGEYPAEPSLLDPGGVRPSPRLLRPSPFSLARVSGEKRGRRLRDTKGRIRAKTSSRPNVPAPTKEGFRWYSCFKT